MKMIAACVLGGSGYGGGELLRLLAQHPHVGAISAVSRSRVGEPLWAVHPNLRDVVEGTFAAEADWSELARAEEPVVFAAMPHGELAQQLPTLEAAWSKCGLSERVTLIDLSGDFRLADEHTYMGAYGRAHPNPQALGTFIYGLPEWRREALRGARRIANPGCFATAIQLALLPLAGLGDLGFIAVSAATGSSGSGASPGETTHHPARAGDFRAYKVQSHQHEAEIRQLLDAESTPGYSLSFVPHSAPLVRGIHATVQLRLPLAVPDVGSRYQAFYGENFFVRLVQGAPRLAAVTGSNFCDIAVHERNGSVAVMAALDNLVKGMAGQAMQNMNLALGLEETSGLRFAGCYPA